MPKESLKHASFQSAVYQVEPSEVNFTFGETSVSEVEKWGDSKWLLIFGANHFRNGSVYTLLVACQLSEWIFNVGKEISQHLEMKFMICVSLNKKCRMSFLRHTDGCKIDTDKYSLGPSSSKLPQC